MTITTACFHPRHLQPALMVMVLLTACGDAPSTGPEPEQPPATGAAAGATTTDPHPPIRNTAATLSFLQQHVIDATCRGCHGADEPAAQLNLSTATASYNALVDVPATNSVAAENRWLRVKPGNPNLSFLIRKLEQPGLGEGAPMPSATQELSPFYVQAFRDWITQGAKP